MHETRGTAVSSIQPWPVRILARAVFNPHFSYQIRISQNLSLRIEAPKESCLVACSTTSNNMALQQCAAKPMVSLGRCHTSKASSRKDKQRLRDTIAQVPAGWKVLSFYTEASHGTLRLLKLAPCAFCTKAVKIAGSRGLGGSLSSMFIRRPSVAVLISSCEMSPTEMTFVTVHGIHQ
jgi:hypothetical protein